MHNRTQHVLRLIQAGGLVTREAPDAATRLREIQQRAQDGVIHRAAEIVNIDEEARTVELAFSSETPVVRWWGEETLSHDPMHVRMGRLSDGAALLWNHDWDDQRGVVESARIDSDRKGRALVRFSRSEEGEKLWQDVKDKIKRHVSVGYFIHGMRLIEVVGELERWLIDDWEPYEISIVSVPADTAVGVGRSADIPPMDTPPTQVETSPVTPTNPTRAVNSTEEEPKRMNIKTLRDASGNLVRAECDDDGNIVKVLEVLERAGEGERSARNAGAEGERTRVREINALAERFGKAVPDAERLAREAIDKGRTPADFQAVILDAVEKRTAQPLNDQAAAADIGLSSREVGEFSLLKVARALADPSSRSLREAAAMEFRASEAAANMVGSTTGNFVIPSDVLRRAVGGDFSRAALSTAMTGAAGGHLVDTTLMSGSFIDMLRKRATILRLGRVLGGLVGNVDVPKQVAGGTGYWVGEGQDVGEVTAGLGNVILSPKTVGGFSDVTRRMLMQSSKDAEALLRDNLAKALALTLDAAGYYGPGTDNTPRGITNYTGINAKAFVGDNPTWGELVDMETAIALDDADVANMHYVAAAGFRGYAKQTPKFPTAGSATIWPETGNGVNGYTCEITNQVQAGDVIFGNFDDLLIGMWGALELKATDAPLHLSGGLRLVAFQDVDFALRRTESFCLGRKAP